MMKVVSLRGLASIGMVLLLPAALLGQAAERVGDSAPLAGPSGPSGGKWLAPQAVLYDNGPLVTHPTGGPGGAPASAVQTALLLSTYGFGHAVSSGYRVADDFTVPAGGWILTQITTFAYQTGSTTTSTINAINFRIWNGPPGQAGSTVVFGDTTTNRLGSSTFANVYRVLDTGLTDATRPIMAVVAPITTSLPAGTYWLDWQVGGTLASGPWAPPVSLVGQTSKPGANAQQFDPTASTWAPMIDDGDAMAPQDLPFILEGAPQGPAIMLEKTVGTTPGVCATTSAITVEQGTTVYYCYRVTNIGDLAFTTHGLVDDQLGTIFSGLSHNLAIGASVDTVTLGISAPAVINATTTNSATWTAAAGATTAPATDTATVTAVPPRCPAGSQVVTLLSADFAGTFPPAGWTLSNTGTTCGAGTPNWTNVDPGARGNLTGGAGAFAIADSDDCGSGSVLDVIMTTPTIDLTGLTDPRLTFWMDYYDIGAGGDQGLVDTSIDNGGTWANLLTYDASARGPLQITQNLPGAGENDFRLRWHYVNGTWDWWWEVDDVAVTACQSLPCTLTPPANITVTAPAGATGLVVTYTVGSTAGCGTVTCTPPSGSTFPIGTTAVNCTSQSGGGTASFTVTVNASQSVLEIPTLAPAGLAGLALLLAGGAVVILRRRRSL